LSKEKFDASTLVHFLQLNLGQGALASNNSLWLCFVGIMLVNFNPIKQNTSNFLLLKKKFNGMGDVILKSKVNLLILFSRDE
jgi:hypothetical protein